MTRLSFAAVSLLISYSVFAAPSEKGLPPPPKPDTVTTSADEAKLIVEKIFECGISQVDEDFRFYDFSIGSCKIPCPLKNIRGAKCGDYTYSPTNIKIFKTSWVASLSGHLARNRVIVVRLFSEHEGLMHAFIHGLLVFPSSEVQAEDKPAFIWYVNRLGMTLQVDFIDMDADGVDDVVYTYGMWFFGGYFGAARDIWKVANMRRLKLISSGQALPGLYGGSFEGLQLHSEGHGIVTRGTWRFEKLEADMPYVIVLQSATISLGQYGDWELQVIGDLGDGWTQVFSGHFKTHWEYPCEDESRAEECERARSEGENEGILAVRGDCSAADIPPFLSLKTRLWLLSLEMACQDALKLSRPTGFDPLDAIRFLYAAWQASEQGLGLVALSLEFSAAKAFTRMATKSNSYASYVLHAVAALFSVHVFLTELKWLRKDVDPRLADIEDCTSNENRPVIYDTLWPYWRVWFYWKIEPFLDFETSEDEET